MEEDAHGHVVRDPKTHPDAVLTDFTHADPLITFDLKDVAFVYGSKWKQRFFTKKVHATAADRADHQR